MSVETYGLLVLGSGEAGKYIAWARAAKGDRVAVVERAYIGGSCPNIACLPSKNVIHSAKVASYFRSSEDFGIGKENWRIHMPGVRDRKRDMVNTLIEINRAKYKASGTELIMGQGRFTGPRTLHVNLANGGTRVLEGQRVVVSTGSRAAVPAVPGLHEANPLTHVGALDLDQIPPHLIVLGGGYVGLELAQALCRLGSHITIVERNDRLIAREDPDVSEAIRQLCIDEGLEIQTGVVLERVEGESGKAVHLYGQQGDSAFEIQGTHILIAGGRTPNTDGIGLELTGVALRADGHVQVNERLETTAENVWAVGDCAGSPHFTHVAFDDYRIVRDNMASAGFGGGNRVTTGRLTPFCLFTDPELARVGLSEVEAEQMGIAYRLAKVPITVSLRTYTLSETRGFMKALVDADSDRILGFTAFGPSAGEVMAVAQIAIDGKLPYTTLRDAVITHPTMAEGLGPLFAAVSPRA